MTKDNDIKRDIEGIKSTIISLEKSVAENSDKTVSTIMDAETVTSIASTIMEVKTTANTSQVDTASKPT